MPPVAAAVGKNVYRNIFIKHLIAIKETFYRFLINIHVNWTNYDHDKIFAHKHDGNKINDTIRV